MKTTTKSKSLTYTLLFALAFLMNVSLRSQCNANFAYTVNPNGNVSFQSTSANTPSNTSYYWSLGNNQTSTTQATSATYSANGIYTVSLFIYAAPTCSAGITHTINVTTAPTITCALTANFTYTIGSNGSVSFSNNSTGTNANTNYYWSFSNNNFAYTPNATANFANNGIYTVCLFISDSLSNCSSSFCDSISITNAPASSCNANFSYSVGTNGNVSFFNTSTGTNSNTVYYWSFNNTSTASGPNPVATFTNTYYNWVCLTIYDSLNFCSSTKCDSIIISQNPCNTNVNFALSQDSAQALTWWAYANYPQNVTNAVWSWGDNTTTNSLYPSHTYSASGFYNICVTITVSCAGTSSFCANSFINKSTSSNTMYHVNVISGSNQNSTGIKTQEQDLSIETRLYPNPAAEKAFLSITTSKESKLTISIYEITGQLLMEKNVNVNKGANQVELDVNSLNKGLYFVNISSGSSKKTVRLVKD
jgi:PKD repeat protein